MRSRNLRASYAAAAAVAVSMGLAAWLFACGKTQGEPGTAVGAAGSSQIAASDGGASNPAELAIDDTEKPTAKLVAFSSEGELKTFLGSWKDREEAKRKQPQVHPMNGPSWEAGAPPPPAEAAPTTAPAAQAAAAPKPAAPAPARAPAHDSSKKDGKAESITNNQHANVDEGDIVKLHGDHLVVLRRGRLFTISLEGGQIKKSATLDAFGPDIDPSGSWYDEMLVQGDNVVVIGFSYQRGGTEVGIFSIDAGGQLRYRSTYHLKSNDYYSARNYASRIVDNRLVFYAPAYISPYEDPFAHFPAVRRWRRGAGENDFIRTLKPTRLYHVADDVPASGYMALHTVTSCDLRSSDLACESVGMIGPVGRVFYVSEQNVYVWMRDWQAPNNLQKAPGVLAKMPIKPGSDVTAMRVGGMPTDQFAFEEADGFLNVFVRSESNGDAMFASETTSGDAAIMRVPLGLFSDGVPIASASRYRRVPRPDGYYMQNRFVGPWLLYGAGTGYWTANQGKGKLFAVRYANKESEPITVELDQGVDRIEPMGDDAVIVGSRGSDLVFSPIELTKEVHARRDYVRKNASQGELRSHGFFYKPSSDKEKDGVIGMPIRGEGTRGARYLVEGSASVLFLANHSLEFSELGALAAQPLTTNHDGCRASCVDWYGNARPIFAKNRIFALMGYELVEGNVKGKSLSETARLSFAPRGGAPAEDDGF